MDTDGPEDNHPRALQNALVRAVVALRPLDNRARPARQLQCAFAHRFHRPYDQEDFLVLDRRPEGSSGDPARRVRVPG